MRCVEIVTKIPIGGTFNFNENCLIKNISKKDAIARAKATGGLFGMMGRKFGDCLTAKSCGDKLEECQKIGKEKGGRKQGSKNFWSFNNKQKLETLILVYELEKHNLPIRTILKEQYAPELSRLTPQEQEKQIENLIININNWKQEEMVLKENYLLGNGNSKQIHVGRKPNLGEEIELELHGKCLKRLNESSNSVLSNKEIIYELQCIIDTKVNEICLICVIVFFYVCE